jgi:hypothetical protein
MTDLQGVLAIILIPMIVSAIVFIGTQDSKAERNLLVAGIGLGATIVLYVNWIISL